jgi:hypothetical protein
MFSDPMAELPQELERVPGQPAHCAHPYYALTHGGQCMGCRKSPLSPNLLDHHARKLREAYDTEQDAA